MKQFITRRDVKAEQRTSGEYRPHGKWADGQCTEYIPWRGRDIEEHLKGTSSFGYYMLGQDDTCKMFAFDVDFAKNGALPTRWDEDEGGWCDFDVWANPRDAWRDRGHKARGHMKFSLNWAARTLSKAIWETLSIPVAVAYTGNKGIHVYGFTGKLPAEDVREAAEIALEAAGGWKAYKGKNFFHHESRGEGLGEYFEPDNPLVNFELELFPKQTTIADKGGFGNLLRLPLGRNLKAPKDPTFFVDMRGPMTELVPMDSVEALTTLNPWAYPSE